MTRKRCEIGHTLGRVLFTNKKLHIYGLSVAVLKSLTDRVALNSPMAVISRYLTQNGSFWRQLCQIHWSYRPTIHISDKMYLAEPSLAV